MESQYKRPRDPLVDALFSKTGIKGSIDVLFDSQCYRAGIIMIFVGIDTMATLAMPAGQLENTSTDFKAWVNKYIHLSGEYQVTPDDWWGARNAIVHTYGVESRDTRTSKAKIIGWMHGGKPSVRYNPQVSPDLVIVDIVAFRQAFYDGMNKFVVDSYADPNKKELMDERIQHLLLQSGSIETDIAQGE